MDIRVWLIIALVTLVLEIVTAGVLVSVWFSVGALAASLSVLLGADLLVQILVFVLGSILAFLTMRPFFMRLFNAHPIGTNADRLIGTKGLLSEAVSETKWGAMVITGMRWSVTTEVPENLPVGTEVEVLRLEGAKLIVRKVV